MTNLWSDLLVQSPKRLKWPRIRLNALAVVAMAVCFFASLAAGQNDRPSNTGEHWVATWATAQQLMATPAGGRSGAPPSNLPATFANQTVRMIVRTSLGGSRVRVELSNMFNAQPVEIGAAHIAIHKGHGATVEGTDRLLTFGSSSSFTIPAGVLVVSDPVSLEIAPFSDLAISIFLPRDTGPPTNHALGLHAAYISNGDVTASAAMPDPKPMLAYAWLSR